MESSKSGAKVRPKDEIYADILKALAYDESAEHYAQLAFRICKTWAGVLQALIPQMALDNESIVLP